MAQSVAHLIGSEEVTGSIPVISFIENPSISTGVLFFIIQYSLLLSREFSAAHYQ